MSASATLPLASPTLTGSAYGSNSVTPGKLHVFNATDLSASEASGSPYTITEPFAIAVASPSQ